MYYRWSVFKLKEELRKRGAVTRGRKEDLIERLESYDRNQDFRGELVELPTLIFPEWPSTGFHQLCPDHRILFPKICQEQLETYFLFRLATDNMQNHDIKALEKGQALLQSMRIEACSVHCTRENIYMTGVVRAAMRKKITYNYKLRLNGQTGEAVNSDCECPAGKGPHGTCKHVAAVFLMVCHFCSTGEMMIKKSCTENIQTFHRPVKQHDGSPVKACNIPFSERKRKVSMDDPRPLKFRNVAGYQDRVRSLTLNYCSNKSQDITLRFLFGKADLQTAANDHDYLKKPFTHYWVEDKLKVTQNAAYEIEKATKDQSKCILWIEERRWRITASHFGEICKSTHRRNKTTLCRNIVNPRVLLCKPIMHGRQYEGKALRQFEDVSGLKVQKAGLFVSADTHFLGASPDGLIGSDAIVEVKCPYSGRDSYIEPGKCFPFLYWSESGEIKLKQEHKYFFQIQGQLYVSKRTTCYFVVFTLKDFFIQEIKYDQRYCEGSMLPKLELFYNKHFLPYVAKSL